MSSAGHIIDAINRIKQNRALKASKRQKFKGTNRDSIYSDSDNVQKAIFKKVSKEKAQSVINRIRSDFKIKRRRDIIYIVTFSLIVSIIVLIPYISNQSTPNNIINNDNIDDWVEAEEIKWNGQESEPLIISNTNYFYIPKVYGLDRMLDSEGQYIIYPPNMVGSETSNIIFLNSDCTTIGKLLNKNGLIFYMILVEEANTLETKGILYSLAEEDSNRNGIINEQDETAIYLSDVNGENLIKISNKPIKWYQLKKGNLLLEFYTTKNSTDSIYGIYDIKNKKLKYANQFDSIK
ncbi:hypothetical protein [Maribacter sp. IgM3_T14_3]|uniref:hypothetical protein n=1 Tax=Maribacter sp. IgM3_T14_3 TaxID=3415140 RepID=UPI003C6F1ACB